MIYLHLMNENWNDRSQLSVAISMGKSIGIGSLPFWEENAHTHTCICMYIPMSLEFQVILSGCIITISENPRLKHTFSRSKIWRILVDLNAFCLSRNQHPHTTYLPWSKVGIQVTIARIPIINMAWMTIGQILCFDNGMAKWVWCRSAPFFWVGRWNLPKSIWMSSWSLKTHPKNDQCGGFNTIQCWDCSIQPSCW